VAVLPWLFALALGLAHFIQPKVLDPDRVHGKVRERLSSFTAGFSVAYLFLWLLPETFAGATPYRLGLFLAMLIGFSLLHLTEQFIYIHDHARRRKLLRDLAVEHSAVFFIYYTLVGISLAFLADQRTLHATLFFVPILLHSFFSRAALGEVHGRMREQPLIQLLLAGSALTGVALASAGLIPPTASGLLFGLIVGAFFYVVIKDLLPENHHGLPRWFFAGAALMAIIALLGGAA
jgi:hypothetical protein